MILWVFFASMVSVAVILFAAIFLWQRPRIKGDLVQAEKFKDTDLIDDESVTRICPEKNYKPDPVAYLHKKCI